MTPERLTLLAALLIETRDWLDATDPGCLDSAILDRGVQVCAEARARLIAEGAR
jgi:hypothetical protein